MPRAVQPIAADAWQLHRVALSASSNGSLEGGVTETAAWFSAQL
jgi:hypothetical protein